MTVAEIKEKINKAIENSAGERKTTAVRYLLSVLHTIKSMLDQLDEWVSVDDRLPTKEDLLFKDEPYFAITYKNDWNEIKTTYCSFDFEKNKFKITGVDVLAWKTFGEPYKESEENE